jgi:hypothetical protein
VMTTGRMAMPGIVPEALGLPDGDTGSRMPVSGAG